MTAAEKAKHIIDKEVFYWGDNGLKTTQKSIHIAGRVKAEMININADKSILDFWNDVKLEIYKQRKND